jgi:hypothetical protein
MQAGEIACLGSGGHGVFQVGQAQLDGVGVWRKMLGESANRRSDAA